MFWKKKGEDATTVDFSSNGADVVQALKTGGRDRYRQEQERTNRWRGFAWMSVAMNILLLIGFIIFALQRREIPIYVAYDASGQFAELGELSHTWDDPNVEEALLRRWIKDVRTVQGGVEATVARIEDAYALVARGKAEAYLNGHFEQEAFSPILLAQQDGKRTLVALEGCINRPGTNEWRIQWVEQLERPGQSIEKSRWEAFIYVEKATPHDAQARKRNLSGLWVIDLSWALMQRLD